MAGPLNGVRIIELAGIGPGPFAAMLLADMGAEVIRVERAQAVRGPAPDAPSSDVLLRGRRNVAIDLKHPDGAATLLDLVEGADALIEGFRPGVTERLGIGPDVCLARNPRLVYGRMTGWGQDGPLAHASGHDINYISLAGALAHFRRAGSSPVPPLNMVGDFGGGGMFLAFGVVCGVLEASRSGAGQVVDAAMVDGAAVLMSMFWAFRSTPLFDEHAPGTNLLDTGAHFYDVYECSDGVFISIGSIEPQFYAELLRLTGLTGDAQFEVQNDKSQWPVLKERIAELFKTRTRDEWCELMEGSDVCFAPVLTMGEAAVHPHNVARSTFVERSRSHATGPGAPVQPDESGARPPPSARRTAHPRGVGRLGRRRGADRRPRRVRRDQAGVSGHARLLPRPSRRRGAVDRRHDGAGHAEGHRVVLVVATNGEHGEVPDDLAPGETLVDRRRSETAQSAAALGIDRVVWLGYRDSGMTGWEQNADPASFLQCRRRRGRRQARRRPARAEAADVLTIYDWHGNYGHPDHIKVHRSACGRPRSWPTISPDSGSSRRRSTVTRSRR